MKTATIIGMSGQDGPYLTQLLLSKNYHVFGTVRGYKFASSKKRISGDTK